MNSDLCEEIAGSIPSLMTTLRFRNKGGVCAKSVNIDLSYVASVGG